MKLSIFLGKVPLLIFTAVSFSSSFAQHRLTLKDCLGYATANNHELNVAGYNVMIANKKVSEQTGNYLPQVNATGTFDDNLALSTQLLPAEMTGGTFMDGVNGKAASFICGAGEAFEIHLRNGD